MPILLTCPRGHQWEANQLSASGASIPCPVCGTIVAGTESTIPPNVAAAETFEFGPTQGRDKVRSPAASSPAPASEKKSDTIRDISQEPFNLEMDFPKIKGYEILSELGRGGMGVVYLAHQEGLDRFVALKMIISGGQAGSDELTRFRTEAAAISRLQHPNLVQIYEVGEQDGRPFFSLEFVDGGNLDDRYNGKPQPPRDAAKMIETLARAMHAVHLKGIVHRDLKPANVMLMADGTPKISDFGLAKRMDSGIGNTQTGAIMGTPSYMAPEQAAGKSREVGPHTDVYALGSMLYEFLSGRPPFMADTAWDTIVQVVSQEPLPPSKLAPKLPRDLDTICLKSLEKNPKKRYATAEELADDLARFLRNEPIHARPIGIHERFVKWVKRRPGLASAALISTAALIAFIAFGAKYTVELQKLEREGRERMIRFSVLGGSRYLEEMDWFGALVWYAHTLELEHDNPERMAMHRVRYASVLQQCPKLLQLWSHQGSIGQAKISADGLKVVTASLDHTGRIWDIKTGQAIGPPLQHDDAVVQASFSRDSRLIVTASTDATARIWDAASGAHRFTLKHDNAVNSACFSPDGRWVLTASDDNTARLWEVSTGKQFDPAMRHAGPVRTAVFSPDGNAIITASDDRTARIWSRETRTPLLKEPLSHRDKVTSACFCPTSPADARVVVTTSDDQTARLWNAQTGELLHTLIHQDRVNWGAFSSDGKNLVTCSDDNSAKVWNVDTGTVLLPALYHFSDVRYAEFSPDGSWVLTCSDDNTARIWDMSTGKPATTFFVHNGTVNYASFGPQGFRIITASDDNTSRLWDLATASLMASKQRQRNPTATSDFGTMPASAQNADQLFLYLNRDFLSPDHKLLLVLKENEVRIKDLATNRFLDTTLRHKQTVNSARFSEDGRRIVTASDDRTACIWNATTGAKLLMIAHHKHRLNDACFSPDRDGKWIATASDDQTAMIWDSNDGVPINKVPLRHASPVSHVAFDKPGQRVITAGFDNTARIWNPIEGEMLIQPMRHDGSVQDANFSPDGTRVATSSFDQTARVWNASTGEPLTPPLRHFRNVKRAYFIDEIGAKLITVSTDNVVRQWDLPTADGDPQFLVQQAQLLAGSRLHQGFYEPLNLHQLMSLFKELKQKDPAKFSTSSMDVHDWRERHIRECEENQQWLAAIWHLNFQIAEHPNNPQHFEERGYNYAELGRWPQALADYEQSLKLDPKDWETRVYILLLLNQLRASVAFLKAYHSLVKDAAASTDPRTTMLVVQTCNILSGNAINRNEVLQMAERAIEKDSTNDRFHFILGAAYYRAGSYETALREFTAANELRNEGRMIEDDLFMAMTYAKLGRSAEARDAFEKARGWIGERMPDNVAELSIVVPFPWYQRLTIAMLRDEARVVIGREKA